ncbi:accessory Sec system protein Asp2 [Peptococcaceae bacterium 1198_IL3148]
MNYQTEYDNNLLLPDGVFKFKNRYIIYSLKRGSSNKLYVVFSGVDSTPGFTRMSYYGLRDSLDGNVLHIKDSFGAHGCYLLNVSGCNQVRNAVLALLKESINQLNIPRESLYLVGTSKGGTIALAYGMMLGFGNVIVGEPQVRIGDFLFSKGWKNAEYFKSIAYVMTGRINEEGKELLNSKFKEIIAQCGSRFRGTIEIITGIKTLYLENHVDYFIQYAKEFGVDESRINVEVIDIEKHDDIVEPFLRRVNET